MGNTYDYVENNGDTKITTTYTGEAQGLDYSLLSDNVSDNFSFLIKQIPDKLDEALNSIRKGANINDAFYFEGSGTYSDLMHAYEELERDINSVKGDLQILYSNLVSSINNVNTELKNNFGDWIFTKARESGHKVETISQK